MNGSAFQFVYKACGGALVTPRRTEHTVLLRRSGMPTNISTRRTDHRQPKAIEERLLNRLVRVPSGCWEWRGAKNRNGYGNMIAAGRHRLTHRLSYELFCGPVPDGMYVCHHCDNPACCNPAHLFSGTPRDNHADMRRKGRAKNPRGSEAAVAKITEADVVEIRAQFASGAPRAGIAARYGLDETTVTHIARGRIWKHVPGRVPSRAEPPKLHGEMVAAALAMRRAGHSYAAVGKRFGVSAETIRRTFRRHGIEG